MIRELRYILAVLIGVSMMSSCVDEPLVSGYGDIPEGHATVSAKVSFKPFGSALNGDSRTAGDAIKEIQSLYVLLYDENKNLKEAFNAGEKNDQGGYKYDYIYEEDESRDDVQLGSDKEHIAEQETPCAKFKKTVPYGRYYIYAVANYDLTDKDYSTIEKLRNLPLTWNADDVKSNNQMFGYFTNGKTNSKPNGWEAPKITIASPTVDLHAWIRRAASKVTVAYDASGLNENIFIYLKSVTIKDIPKECYLGKDNIPDGKREGISDELLEGETIYYGGAKKEHTVADYQQWPRIASGSKYYYYTTDADNPTSLENAHTEDMNALFFFENMQPDYKDLPDKRKYDKRQDAWNTNDEEEADGVLDEPGLKDKDDPGWKDNVEYGTYIEVEAYYDNTSEENVSHGRIFYRFMLGKDVKYNYSAERNYHYKLTLKFKGNANDVDWHIDYEEDEGIYVPNPWYVSYLYGQQTTIPVKVVGMDDNTCLKAEIIENNWYPHQRTGEAAPQYYDKNKVYTYVADSGIGDIDNNVTEKNGYEIKKEYVLGQPWNGFLSLRSKNVINGDLLSDVIKNEGDPEDNGSWSYKDETDYHNNWWYWTYYKIGYNEYSVANSHNSVNNWETYEAKNNNDGSYLFNIPLWTRQKNLIPSTGYTGNNVNVGHLRLAKVRFTATINGIEKYQDVDIIQVRRMVNPTGIYRDYNSTKSFDVTLRYQETTGSDFVPLVSEGPWTAKVKNGSNWVMLDGKLNGEVSGSTGSVVRFTYAPSSTISSNEVRCGIIEVTYHNNSCTHLIFVRQGYAPWDVAGDGTQWYTFNMQNKDSLTSSPIEEGSLFKYGNWNDAILAENNPGPMVPPASDYKYSLAGGTKKTWNAITFSTAFSDNGNYKIPTKAQWDAISDPQEMGFGFGILYDDNATETAVSMNKAYGIDRTENGYGMRGCFVYHKDNSNNIFFPIGREGYGRRRREWINLKEGINVTNAGLLQYANRSLLYEGSEYGYDYDSQIKYRPMFWDIYNSFGAIYWRKNDGSGTAWDINYHTLGFGDFLTNAGTGAGDTDACFIRCVVNGN